MRTLLLAAALLAAVPALRAQVRWMTWDEAMAAQRDEPRKIFVDVFTEWCGWCKRMDATTFSDRRVAPLLNDGFYAVKLDAEQRGELEFNGHTYAFRPGGRRGVHELAAELLGGRLGYPSVVFLDEGSEVIQAVPGYQEADDFLRVASYFGTDAYRTTPWADYAGE